jgi:signal transduction histidine kinase
MALLVHSSTAEAWPRRIGGLTLKVVFGLGFLITAGIWLFAGYVFSGRIADLEQRAAAVSGRYMRAQELVSSTRAHVYRASIFVRDALLDPRPRAGRYRAEVDTDYREADADLAQYVPVLDTPTERERVGRLRADIGQLRSTMQSVLATDSTQWRADAGELLRTRIMPRRDEAIHVAEELQSLNRTAYVEQQAETALLYRATQRQFWQTLGFAILAGLGVGIFATLYAHRLEHRLREQQEKDARAAVDLQRLSAKLVSAQEEERRIIARELHDEVGQVLTAVKMELAYAQRELTGIDAAVGALDEARTITDRALHAVRDLTHLLHPPLLDDLGLPAAVDWYVQSIQRRQQMRIQLTADGMSARLPADIEVACYRIVQEALTNVCRHAQASYCRIGLTRRASSILLSVEDDGVGFSAERPAGTGDGLGLIGIRERVAGLGGQLRIESAPGRGTRLTAELPIPTVPDAGIAAAEFVKPRLSTVT